MLGKGWILVVLVWTVMARRCTTNLPPALLYQCVGMQLHHEKLHQGRGCTSK